MQHAGEATDDAYCGCGRFDCGGCNPSGVAYLQTLYADTPMALDAEDWEIE